MHTIAYLGPPGTYSEAAVLAFAPHAAHLPMASMPAVVTAVETDAADAGMLPIENVLEGSVTTTLDLLIHETDLRISGETVVPIRHYLMTRPGVRLADLKVLHLASAGALWNVACQE
jgi:prephenate dehydratase